MKQLKIIVPQVDTRNPFFTASFTESIAIAPNSRIAFDKISFNIVSSGVDGSIQLGAQTIQVSPNIITGPLSQGPRGVSLAPATYPNVSELFKAIQTALNGCLNSNPVIYLNGKMPDTGLAFQASTADGDVTRSEISFVQAACVAQNNAITDNINYQGEPTYWWVPTADPWSLIYPTPLLAGALRCDTAVYFPDLVDYGDNECFVGLYTQNGAGAYIRTYGLILQAGVWSYYNQGGISEIVNQAAFNSPSEPPTTFISFFVDANDGSHLKVGLFDFSDPNLPTQIFASPNLTFLGYNVNTNYYFGADGSQGAANLPVKIFQPTITYMPNLVNENNGWRVVSGDSLNKNYKGLEQLTFGAYAPFPNLDVPGPRNVRIDFTNAQALQRGLGFSGQVYNLVGPEGSITSDGKIGFVNFFDLALDLYNFTLESYMSSPVTKGRVAAVGYFIPIPTTTTAGQSTFYAENKQLVFIDIKNKQDQVIESLNFRLYNPAIPSDPFLLTNVSFTLFIETSEDVGY